MSTLKHFKGISISTYSFNKVYDKVSKLNLIKILLFIFSLFNDSLKIASVVSTEIQNIFEQILNDLS